MGQQRSKFTLFSLLILLTSFQIGSSSHEEDQRIVSQLKLMQLDDPCESTTNCTDSLIRTMTCIHQRCSCDPTQRHVPIDLNGYRSCGMQLGDMCIGYAPLPARPQVIKSLQNSGLDEEEIQRHLERYERLMTSLAAFPPEQYTPLDLGCVSRKCLIKSYECVRRVPSADQRLTGAPCQMAYILILSSCVRIALDWINLN